MSERKHSFVKIDELQREIDIETACQFYGVESGTLQRIGNDIRSKCFLQCGKTEETGDRAIAIDAKSDVKRWRCHQYGCGKGGNLVTLCDLMKPGTNCGGQQPRGERFKEIRDDLRMMVSGNLDELPERSTVEIKQPVEPEPRFNVPLADSPNERARGLVNLDDKFVVVADESMNKDAAAYVRRHPFLTPEVCREERCGYLPRPGDSSDRRGGTLQGMWVYCYRDEQGQPLTWFGRNLRFDKQHKDWVAGGRSGKEPAKFHFVKGFHRGLEVYGQHEWSDQTVRDQIREIGILILVEGPNDRIALKLLGVPAFAICSNVITVEQVKRVSDQACQIGVPVGVMFDTDAEGENGALQSIALIAQHCPVRYVWSTSMFDGRFKGRQPESVCCNEISVIRRRPHERGEG